ncbi:hypothetical protein HYFRA_00005333 [Hymenoscyphus fraxineus]|uniref:RNA polymerase I associated factor, A49-like protein n=1 Tax=Hymenoscyphus fraxineus TaxID=746836 RepID=A0A9N9LD42_9HELO|nr:hypothetical protein HYFRA_00005333 [Hymenoscyphus fraxineus]
MTDKTEKAKKRKRQVDGSSKPSKRVAIEGDKQVKISFQETEKWAPVVASSRGLAIPDSISLQPFTQKRKNVALDPRKTTIANTELLLQSSAHHKLDYTAREESSDGLDALLKHYVGIYDPETGKMEVMEARKMAVRGTVRAHQVAIEDLEVELKSRDQRNQLGQTFGTKKSKKSIASFTENAINPGHSRAADGVPTKIGSGDKAILETIGTITSTMATKEQLAAEIEGHKPRPKANLGAKDVKDVYTIEGLIGENILALIPVKQWLEKKKAKQDLECNSRYVASKFVPVGVDTVKLKALRYILFLLEVLDKSTSKRAEKKLPRNDEVTSILDDMPRSVWEDFKSRFTTANMISRFQYDLIVTHICALACILDAFDVYMYDLQEDLKLDAKKIETYFREVGAKTVALPVAEQKRLGLSKVVAAQRKMAKLRLPLVFPTMSFARK